VVIRSEQMQALEAPAIRAFEERTYTHLQRYFPHHCLLLGQEQMHRVIHTGWQKSKSYGLTAECCVRTYIELMCLLGGGFDRDPLLPWAAQVLNHEREPNQVKRGDRLYDVAWKYIHHVERDYRDADDRPGIARFIRELRTLPGRCDGIAAANMRLDADDLIVQIERLLPAKCAYVGEERLRLFLAEAIGTANKNGIYSERAWPRFAVLMFVFGTGFAEDPLLPWASSTLNDFRVRNEIEKLDRLHAMGLAYIERSWVWAPTAENSNVAG